MAAFLDRVRDIAASGEARPHQAHYTRVVAYVNRHLERLYSRVAPTIVDLHNIESVFSLAEMACLVGYLPGADSIDEIRAFRDSLRVVIADTIERSCMFTYDGGTVKPHQAYQHLVYPLEAAQRLGTSRDTAFITFNYDIALDYAIYAAKLGVDYSIQCNQPNWPKVKLLKLHGSINWFRCAQCNTVLPLSMWEYFAKAPPPALKTDRFLLQLSEARAVVTCPNGHGVPQETAIVPPSWNKTQYHSDFRNVWADAVRELSEASEITIIGLSLAVSDEFFKNLFALGIDGTSDLRLVRVVTPDDDAASRFHDLLGPYLVKRFGRVPYRFEQYDLPAYQEAVAAVQKVTAQ